MKTENEDLKKKNDQLNKLLYSKIIEIKTKQTKIDYLYLQRELDIEKGKY